MPTLFTHALWKTTLNSSWSGISTPLNIAWLTVGTVISLPLDILLSILKAIHYTAHKSYSLEVSPVRVIRQLTDDDDKKDYLLEALHNGKTWKETNRGRTLNFLATFFAPLTDLGKNLVDTFKPYKYDFHYEFSKIIVQPFDAIAYMISGLYRIISSPIYGCLKIANALLILLVLDSNLLNFGSNLVKAIVSTPLRIVDGALQIITGATQLAITPFIWLVKPVVRSLITLIAGKPKIEDNAGIKMRLAFAESAKNHKAAALTYLDIHRKFLKCLDNGQNTAINVATENDLVMQIDPTYSALATTTTKPYAKLFKPAPGSNVAVENNIEPERVNSNSAYQV